MTVNHRVVGSSPTAAAKVGKPVPVLSPPLESFQSKTNFEVIAKLFYEVILSLWLMVQILPANKQ